MGMEEADGKTRQGLVRGRLALPAGDFLERPGFAQHLGLPLGARSA